MRVVILALVGCGVVCAQAIVPAGQLNALLARFDSRSGLQPLRCGVIPGKPALNFAFRYQAGYSFRVPSTQYQGSNHTWYSFTKVTPDGGDHQPVYLFARHLAADVTRIDLDFDMGGTFLLGPGSYSVESILEDDQNRACKRDWHIEAAPARSERFITPGDPPFTVRELGSRATQEQEPHYDAKSAGRRMTILFDAAPISQRRTALRAGDRRVLLTVLTGLMGRVPAANVRLVVFSLEQQKELLRDEHFTLDRMDQVSSTLEKLDLDSVNVSVLQNPQGHVDLLTRLVNRELTAGDSPDTVVFLGPLSRYHDKLPDGAFTTESQAAPQFFYVQYRFLPRRPPPVMDAPPDDFGRLPGGRGMSNGGGPGAGAGAGANGNGPQNPSGGGGGRGTPDPSNPSPPPPSGRGGRGGAGATMGPPPVPSGITETDIINTAVARLKGKSMVVRTPVEFARAVRRIERD